MGRGHLVIIHTLLVGVYTYHGSPVNRTREIYNSYNETNHNHKEIKMFDKIKEKLTDEDFQFHTKKIVTMVVTQLVVITAVKVVTYVAVEGTKALIEELSNKS